MLRKEGNSPLERPLGHACLLAFDRDSADFARGFEAGRIWAILRANPDETVRESVHSQNAEMILRMAEATGRQVWTTELDSEWLGATFEPNGVFD